MGWMDTGHPPHTRHQLCVGLDKAWGTQSVWGMAGAGMGPILHGAEPHWAQGTRHV